MKKEYLLAAGLSERQILRVMAEEDKFEEQLRNIRDNEYADVVKLWKTIPPEQWENYEKLFGKKEMYEQRLLRTLRFKLKKAWLELTKKKK